MTAATIASRFALTAGCCWHIVRSPTGSHTIYRLLRAPRGPRPPAPEDCASTLCAIRYGRTAITDRSSAVRSKIVFMNLSGFTGTSGRLLLEGLLSLLILLHAGGRCANHVPFPPIASISKRCAGQLRVPHPRLVRVGLSFRVPHSGRPRLVTNGLLRWTPLRPVTGVELTYAEFAPTPWVGARVSQSSEQKAPPSQGEDGAPQRIRHWHLSARLA